MYLLNWLSKDGKLLLSARIVRAFSYGFLSIVLAIYLKSIGFNEILIGVILSVTLVNSVIFTMFASFYADRFGRRRILTLYAALMAVSGVIFLLTDNYIALISAAFIGTVNVTGAETSAFLSIEQATLPKTVKDIKKRNTAFGFYNMVGMSPCPQGSSCLGFHKYCRTLWVFHKPIPSSLSFWFMPLQELHQLLSIISYQKK